MHGPLPLQQSRNCLECANSNAYQFREPSTVYQLFTNSTARATTLSRLKPKRLSTSEPGADAPKRSTQIVAPSSPTHWDQPREEPASIASRALTSRGSIWSRYSCGCSKNSSQHGMEMTLARIPLSVESFS